MITLGEFVISPLRSAMAERDARRLRRLRLAEGFQRGALGVLVPANIWTAWALLQAFPPAW